MAERYYRMAKAYLMAGNPTISDRLTDEELGRMRELMVPKEYAVFHLCIISHDSLRTIRNVTPTILGQSNRG